MQIEQASIGESSDWIIGTAIGRHVCNNGNLFKSFKESEKEEYIYTVYSNTGYKIEGVGKISLLLASGKILELPNVCYVPSMVDNWISVGLLTRVGFTLEMVSDRALFKKNGQFFVMGFVKQGRFVLVGLAQVD